MFAYVERHPSSMASPYWQSARERDRAHAADELARYLARQAEIDARVKSARVLETVQ